MEWRLLKFSFETFLSFLPSAWYLPRSLLSLWSNDRRSFHSTCHTTVQRLSPLQLAKVPRSRHNIHSPWPDSRERLHYDGIQNYNQILTNPTHSLVLPFRNTFTRLHIKENVYPDNKWYYHRNTSSQMSETVDDIRALQVVAFPE